MAKPKSYFFCQECGYQSSSWLGRCPECGKFGTFAEEVVKATTTSASAHSRTNALSHRRILAPTLSPPPSASRR